MKGNLKENGTTLKLTFSFFVKGSHYIGQFSAEPASSSLSQYSDWMKTSRHFPTSPTPHGSQGYLSEEQIRSVFAPTHSVQNPRTHPGLSLHIHFLSLPPSDCLTHNHLQLQHPLSVELLFLIHSPNLITTVKSRRLPGPHSKLNELFPLHEFKLNVHSSMISPQKYNYEPISLKVRVHRE